MGTLKAKVNGVWTPVVGSAQAAADTARWNSAWGVIGARTAQSNTTLTTNTQTTLSSFTLDLVAGRKYQLRVGGTTAYASTVGDTWEIGVTMDAVAIAAHYWQTDVANQYFPPSEATSYFSPTTGSHVFVLYGKRVQASGGTMQARFFMEVEDVGPSTQVAVAPPAGARRVVASGNALGIVAMGSFIPPLAPRVITVSTETALTYALPFFATVGRRYRVKFQARAGQPTGAAGNSSFYLRDNGNAYRGWNPGGDPYMWFAGAYTAPAFEWGFEGDGLQHSIEVLCNGIGMNLYVDYGIFYIEDVGPNSSPALPIPETPPLWTPVSAFQNSWVNYAGTRPLTSYRKIGDVVELRVAVKNGTNGASMFTMPVGFRPPYILDFMGRDGTTSPATCLYNVNADGSVIIYSSGGAGFNGICAFNCSYSTTA